MNTSNNVYITIKQ